MALVEQLIHEVGKNQFFVGAGAAGAMGYVLMQLRSIPRQIFHGITDQFTVHLTVRGEDIAASDVHEWLGDQASMRKSRKLAIDTKWVEASTGGRSRFGMNTTQRSSIVAGPGTNYVWYKKRLLRVHVSESNSGSDERSSTSYSARVLTTTISTWGRSRWIFDQMMADIAAMKDESLMVSVFVWRDGSYEKAASKAPRPLSTMFIDEELKKEIVADATNFYENKKWWNERAIPHRRGYLLDGPPGTGKSSFIFSLASELKRPIFVINPTNMTDVTLGEAMAQCRGGIVVMEDIDGAEISSQRSEDKSDSKGFLSLSGLLNAIDGLSASEERILVLTSNRPEVLDAALTRPGRIDRKFHIGYLSHDLANAMTELFLGDTNFFDEHVAPIMETRKLSGAELQNILLEEIHRIQLSEDDQQLGSSAPPL
ncbi:AAA domain containing protein [uncultured Caudovirales phage]|uniref:AAA domain containing protein n=1 Tax=uncultured Caudovirales phage TaxID=2100421 RepID=A0A6J5KP08_9CAUD|nr:AAA domain containing protein [uncultured Caudovirales phage]